MTTNEIAILSIDELEEFKEESVSPTSLSYLGRNSESYNIDSSSDIESSTSDRDIEETKRKTTELETYQTNLEQKFTCPLTLDFMIFPIKASDNYIYERYAILEWFFLNKTSPMTREELTLDFEPQHDLQIEIRNYLKINNIDCPVLTDTGFVSWKKLLLLQEIVKLNALERYSENNENDSEVNNNEINTNTNDRNNTNTGNRDSRDNIIRVRERRNRRRRDQIIVCNNCNRSVRLLSFRRHPFQTCQCGQIISYTNQNNRCPIQ